MGALCAEGLDLAGDVDEQHLCVLDSVDLDLSLGARGDGERRDVLELVFLCHGSNAQGEAAC